MKVFIQLPADLSIAEWQKNYLNGKIVGINDPDSPYGYSRIKDSYNTVEFSQKPKNMFLCKVLRKLFGMDLWNTFKNRKSIFSANIVWTHTEVECFAVAFLSLVFNREIKILGQCVWLMDKWDNYSFFRKMIYKTLVRKIDVLTFHSPLNSSKAKKIFPRNEVKIVKFGIPTENIYPVNSLNMNRVLKVVAIGNDIHRDWDYLIETCGNNKSIDLTIISTKIDKRLIEGFDNIRIKVFDDRDLFISFVKSNHVSIVPLKNNLHASGLTAIQESIILGIPVICSNKGGLDYYFTDEIVSFFEDDLDVKLEKCLKDYDYFLNKSKRAKKYLSEKKIGADYYIKDQLDISYSLLKGSN